MFLQPIGQVKTTILSATSRKVAASDDVLGGIRNGRHAISVSAVGANAYVGDKNVTTANGILVPSGTTMIFPMRTDSKDNVYVICESGGKVQLGEFF